MKTYSEPAEYAFLMHKTGYRFYQVYPFIRSQDAYFYELGDEEEGNEESMTAFIKRTTALTWVKIRALSAAQLQFVKAELSPDEEDKLVCEMLRSLSERERAMAGPGFLEQVYSYPLEHMPQ